MNTPGMDELLRDPGYPGFDQAFLETDVYHSPARLLREEDLEKFWLLEFRWPNGLTPLGMTAAELCYSWASQAAVHEAPVPVSMGFDIRFVGPHCYAAELPMVSDWELENRSQRFDLVVPPFVENFAEIWREESGVLLAAARSLETFRTDGRSLSELAAYLRDVRANLRWSWERHFVLMYRLLAQQVSFYDFCDELQISRADVSSLLQGYPNKVVDSDEALWRVAERGRELGLGSELNRDHPRAGEFLDRLAAGSGDGSEWVQEFNSYLDEWGWRNDVPMDPASSAWIEDPAKPLAMIRTLLADGESHDFAAARAAARERRETTEENIKSRLTRPEIEVFLKALKSVRKANFVWWNEDHNFYIDMRAGIPLRRAAAAIGRVLNLADPLDTLFCFYPELMALAEGRLQWDGMRGLIDERKSYYQMWLAKRSIMPKTLGEPPTEFSDPIFTELEGVTPEFLDALTTAGVVDKLKGMAACAGRARGPARLVRSGNDLGDIEPGDIMVCEGTAPSWTLAFTKIAGCLTDQGGALCHAAIVSREYDVPCIVALGIATTSIADGAIIEMDGELGEVVIHRQQPK